MQKTTKNNTTNIVLYIYLYILSYLLNLAFSTNISIVACFNIHRLFNKKYLRMCYTFIYYFNIDIQNNEELWIDPLHIDIIVLLNKKFVPIIHHTINFHGEGISAQCVHPTFHLIMSEEFSFEVLFQ
jgi:hypothetical protein